MTIDVPLWDAVAAVLEYPSDHSYFERVTRCVDRLEAAAPNTIEHQAAAPLARMRDTIAGCGLGTLQERYTAAFDFDPACTLDVGWHLFSDGPERGPWLATLRADLAEVGVAETGELPDHLVHLLMLIAREPDPRATQLAGIVAPVVRAIRERLAARGSDFMGAVDAAAMLVGAPAQCEGERRD
jgi:nitrate reductase assembly molybdenum cofactor insertion protein NarJ